MSILIKPYEISVWDDIWNSQQGKFIERRLGIIGSNEMLYQGRAIEPMLTKNVNGTKKLSFKMYKYFFDNVTGEKTANPFSDWLISERKVKLKYGVDEEGNDKWYDFIVKDVAENSSNYLYTYQLEDALVQELSKNGFNVVLDQELMNNIGTSKELAETVLEDTDWNVVSEVLVERIEEDLVYITIPKDTKVYHITDQQDDMSSGISIDVGTVLQEDWNVLAFYSACANRPHRFQFIHLENYDNVSTDENRNINVANCQYYLEVDNSEYVPLDKKENEESEKNKSYVQSKIYPQFYLPRGCRISDRGLVSDTELTDTTISYKYRGKRYGFAQETKYVPLLERYCQKYLKNNTVYYGYVDNKYDSPVFLQNVITNVEFKGTSGWTGTYVGGTPDAKSAFGIKVESVYGRFLDDGNFSSVVEELSNGAYDEKKNYISYLKITCPAQGTADRGILINSGFYDNRTSIGLVDDNEEWIFSSEIYDENGNATTDSFDFKLAEVAFNPNGSSYEIGSEWASLQGGIMKFGSNVKKTPEIFKKKKIKLVITPQANIKKEKIYYIKDMQLYKKVLNDKAEIIRPGDVEIDGVITKTYKLFPESNVEGNEKVDDIEKLDYDTIDEKEFDYNTYIPVYNPGAQKVRSVTAKESNYFNILQSIAETFEAWLELEIVRDKDTGAILSKTAKFKNYSGGNNYAAFRYGVNLKDIQRTYASKNIVTKLIVKQNNNELAKNGFCTIARANSNVTGENYIYDFQYFFKMGMLREDDYVASLYYANNPYTYDADSDTYGVSESGPDVSDSDDSYNLQNYFNRIKNLNTKMTDITDKVIPLQQELTKYKADLAVQEGIRDAAADGIEQVREDFYVLTGLTPETISADDFSDITCTIPEANSTNGVNEINYADWAKDASVQCKQIGSANSTEWKFEVSLSDVWSPVEGISLQPLVQDDTNPTWDEESQTLTSRGYYGLKVLHKYVKNRNYKLTYTLTCLDNNLIRIGGHNLPFIHTKLRVKVGDDGTWKEISDGSYQEIAAKSNDNIYVETYGVYNKDTVTDIEKIGTNCFFIQPNRGDIIAEGLSPATCKIESCVLEERVSSVSSTERTIYIQPTFILTIKAPVEPGETEVLSEPEGTIGRSLKIACAIPAYSNTGSVNYSLAIVDLTASNIQNLLTQYAEYTAQYKTSKLKAGYNDESNTWVPGSLEIKVKEKEEKIQSQENEFEILKNHKIVLNKLFFEKYSRFIQEGTWISEEYIDDDKYYADALSVMYNSCYPQVSYTINVLALSALPGYEFFDFDVGEKTYAEDPEFFGEKVKEEVIIAEMSENLDDPSKNTIKVQNFKNQFQDLFQKITATVQQAQYNTGSYEKAVALAEANAKVKGQFLSEAISDADAKLSAAGQTSIEQGVNGLTLTDERTKDQMRLIGGAILMNVQDEETGERVWKTGLTPEGISASLVTAGTINTGNISIMNGKDATFMWNAFGLSAFDTDWTNGEITGIPKKDTFVRFDKYGIYGIKPTGVDGVDGTTWKPTSAQEIDDKATFALTWEGLKVTGNNNTVARIGKLDNNIVNITREGQSIFRVGNDGSSEIAGWTISSKTGYAGGFYHDVYNGNDKSSNPTHRCGLKIENGTDERYAFYVKKFKENQALWDKPTGDLVFGVKYDGTVIATKGKIGTLDIASIPDDGYMASSVNDKFSWKFSPTDGMFMWNGEQGEATDEDKTAGAIFAIYNAETKDNPKFQLSMKGHIEAESGRIGDFQINYDPVLGGDLLAVSPKEDTALKLQATWTNAGLYLTKNYKNNKSDFTTYLTDGILYIQGANPCIGIRQETADGNNTIYFRGGGFAFNSGAVTTKWKDLADIAEMTEGLTKIAGNIDNIVYGTNFSDKVPTRIVGGYYSFANNTSNGAASFSIKTGLTNVISFCANGRFDGENIGGTPQNYGVCFITSINEGTVKGYVTDNGGNNEYYNGFYWIAIGT